MRSVFYIILSLLTLISCSEAEELDILGTYEMDKYVLRAGITSQDNMTEELILFPDHTFGLTHFQGLMTVTGKWEVADISIVKNNFNELEKEAKILFHFGDKHITGKLRGTIFRFESPNDFRPDIYKHRIFVKSNKKPAAQK